MDATSEAEWQELRELLSTHGVAGVDDLGRFTSKPEFFGASRFDEGAAMPVLIAALPQVTDSIVASTIAAHLRRPWARPAAFDSLLGAFRTFGGRAGDAGWTIGDSLVNAATVDDVPVLLDLITDTRYGRDRQMIVFGMYRFRRDAAVAPALDELLGDDDVSLHAISAYRRSVPDDVARARLERLEQEFIGSAIAKQARAAIKKIDKKAG